MAPRVDWAIPCRYAEQAPDGTATIVGAGTNHFTVPLPAPVGVMVCLAVAASDADAAVPFVVDAALNGPDLQPAMPPFEITVDLGERPANLPAGWEQRAALVIAATWTAIAAGTYGLTLSPRGGGKGTTVDLVVADGRR